MKNIIQLLFVCITGSCICSCADLTFGDKFLGSQPESSGAVLDTMFSSKAKADQVLNTAYTFLPYRQETLPKTNWEATYSKLSRTCTRVSETRTRTDHVCSTTTAC